MSVWCLCALLLSLIDQTEQDGNQLPVKEVTVYPEKSDKFDKGEWVLNVTWRDEFAEKNQSEKLTYDIEVLHTEQMRTVHFETIQVMPDPAVPHHWKWTSSVPLQCTSHSVRLRRRDPHQTSSWTPLNTYEGEDQNATTTLVYPDNQVFLVGSNVTFCCILKTEKVQLFSSSFFTIRISNRTYITKPVHFNTPTTSGGENIQCLDDGGSTIFIGYPPDDQNLTCVTRDLSSVECHWKRGRKTHLEGDNKTFYTLNGSVCKFDQCVLHKNNATNWTLNATNPLGVKTITDTAEPKHRVWLRAPKNIQSRAVHARNATLQWSWNMENYASFPMTCQVELNGSIYNVTFRGLGLSSVILLDLQPSAKYTAKVQCGSNEHFYRWGDWSEMTDFSTKEDIPEEVDIWMKYWEQNTYIVWKPLTKQQSNGIITGYELTISDSKDKWRNPIHRGLKTPLCHNLTSGNEKGDQIITVSASNSAGLSPPSSITIPSFPDNGVSVSPINSSKGGFTMFWEESSRSSCGYVVDWFPTYSKKHCAVEWRKIPSGHLSTWIPSEFFQPGVRYTISVYACTAGAPQLLQRREGYAVEQRPFEKIQNLRSERKGRTLVLSWNKVPLGKQGGFILGYRLVIFNSDINRTINTKTTREPTASLTLDPGSYTINISAYTSAGEGDNATISFLVEKSIHQMIAATVVGSSVAALVFIFITVLCFRKRKWLKEILYPDIPEPKLTGEWTKKGVYCSPLTEGYMKCEIQEAYSTEDPPTSLESGDSHALIIHTSRVCPAHHFYQNTYESPFVSSSPDDAHSVTLYSSLLWPCIEKLSSVIENPTYNMTLPESVGVSQIPELTLEMQDSYLPAPNFVHNNFDDKDSLGYKAQASWPTNV
ncbi:LIF receptor subunit alpha b [Myxocyprinus asiaticus]|uniref:LIF receptor subunit alpha b n=1 Tax=Myxocyprinus asiaticus TaxID=70543 RepID=UPI002223E3E2|nr:LIF receptor subunit alpha b [Myxocyprinus asiaticus]XP_051532877.1 LIF receptor subunit alpha b [Myxocyprinus asiaticus]XP_051532878.1 LIF receptor subunit alpha b [Myxocyprinus asiaticus]